MHIFLSVDEAEGVSKFLSDATAQWKNLALEVRSVRSMLEEVISNWEKYSSTVAALQAWLEDAEQMLNQSENAKRVSTITDTSYNKHHYSSWAANISATKLYEELQALVFVFLSFRISSETSPTGCSSIWA